MARDWRDDRIEQLERENAELHAHSREQQALIEQSQMVTLPLHGADAVVTVVIHVYVFATQLNGCDLRMGPGVQSGQPTGASGMTSHMIR